MQTTGHDYFEIKLFERKNKRREWEMDGKAGWFLLLLLWSSNYRIIKATLWDFRLDVNMNESEELWK